MTFKIGQKVKFKLFDTVLTGEIHSDISLPSYGNGVTHYWVTYKDPRTGEQDSHIAEASELVALNDLLKCTCGAASVNHPGHSYWCEAYI